VSLVYSERLLLASTNGVWSAYVVPSAKRAVVMTVAAANAGTATAQALVAVGGWTVFSRSVPVGASVLDTSMRLVAYAGERIEGRPSGAGCAIIAAGFLFDDVAGARAPEYVESDGPVLADQWEELYATQ